MSAMKRLAFVASRRIVSMRAAPQISLVIRSPLILRTFSVDFTTSQPFAPDPVPLQLAKQFSHQVSTSQLSTEDIYYYIRTCQTHQTAFTASCCKIFFEHFSRINLRSPGALELLDIIFKIYFSLQERHRLTETDITEIMVMYENIVVNNKSSPRELEAFFQSSIDSFAQFIIASSPLLEMRRISMCYYSLKLLPLCDATLRVVHFLNNSLMECKESCNGRSLARIFRGISCFSSTSAEMKQFCNIITAKLTAHPALDVDSVSIANILSSMRTMASVNHEVRRLLHVLCGMMVPHRGSFNGNMLGSMLTGMRRMESSRREVRQILEEIHANMLISENVSMGPHNVSGAFYGLQRMQPIKPVLKIVELLVPHIESIPPSAFTIGHFEAILFGLRYFSSSYESVERILSFVASAMKQSLKNVTMYQISGLFATLCNKNDTSTATCQMVEQLNSLIESNGLCITGDDARKILGGIASMTGNSEALMQTMSILSTHIRQMDINPELCAGLYILQTKDAMQPAVRQLFSDIVLKLPPFDFRDTVSFVGVVGMLQNINFKQFPEHIVQLDSVLNFVENEYIQDASANVEKMDEELFSNVKVSIEMLGFFNESLPEQQKLRLQIVEQQLAYLSAKIGPKAPYPLTVRKSRMMGDVCNWILRNGFKDPEVNTVLHGRDVDVSFMDVLGVRHALFILGDVCNAEATIELNIGRTQRYLAQKYDIKVHSIFLPPYMSNKPVIPTDVLNKALDSLQLKVRKR